MKTTIICIVPVVSLLVLGGRAYADHDKNCQNAHGKVTVVTDQIVAVDDKPYTVGDTTRITKGGKRITLKELKPGDIVCVDNRGKADIGNGEIAGLAVLSPSELPPKREVIREKQTTREVVHHKNCEHTHGKVKLVTPDAILLDSDDQAFVIGESTRITRDGEIVSLKALKPGAYVCLQTGEEEGANHRLTSVAILKPSDAAVLKQREVIKEKVTEKVPEEK